ncbi:tau 95 subunit of transcription factor TFIIIC [Mycoemilia scoparia]|uniref:Tau 95 subunit of transcription factor TFIIIC n=1 Tax=Mycoemilia scoparia TaxID=417184 RepID=A0A9W8A9F6_9FUNG|nr:tau 95 subunit of transcription factor TFIIIC [Mycoemilia scoparia]
MESYEKAERNAVPNTELYVVEYPGYVKNPDKALATLGGTKKLTKYVYHEGGVPVELRYRPDDLLSHPIEGESIPTGNLLIKVTRRVKKNKKNSKTPELAGFNQEAQAIDNQPWKAEVVGVIKKTVRFRSIIDYQIVPEPEDPVMKLLKNVNDLNFDSVSDFVKNEIFNRHPKKGREFMPFPPMSKPNWPMNYNYQQNPHLVKVFVHNNPNEPPVVRLINRNKSKRYLMLSAKYETKNLPLEPPSEIKRTIETVSKQDYETIKKLFEQRPIWTRAAIDLQMPDKIVKTYQLMKRLLPMVAYWMSNGPWRDCWIRYGYDPRVTKEAREYQVVDIRNLSADGATRLPVRSHLSASGLKGKGQQLSFAKYAEARSRGRPKGSTGAKRLQSDGMGKSAHRFDGRSTEQVQFGSFQLCDIDLPLVLRLKEYPAGQRSTCCEQSGWFYMQVIRTIRKVVKLRMQLILDYRNNKVDQELPDPSLDDHLDFAALQQGIEKEKDELEQEKQEKHNVQQQEKSLHQARAGKADEGSHPLNDVLQTHINSRVELLMKELSQQQQQKKTSGDGGPSEEENSEGEGFGGMFATLEDMDAGQGDDDDDGFGDIFGDGDDDNADEDDDGDEN